VNPTWVGIERFILGIVSSFTGAFIVWTIFVLRERWALRRMEGHWLVVEETTPRYSLGLLQFSFWTKRHRYDGYKYAESGERILHWETVKAYFDADHMKFLYIYEVTHFDRGGKTNHGFGQIIIPTGGVPVGSGETDGFFVDAEKAGSDMHVVRCFRAEDVAKNLKIVLDPNNEEDRKNFIVQLAAKNWSGR